MYPDATVSILTHAQAAISSLLVTYEPQFLSIGRKEFAAFALIAIAWNGAAWVQSSGDVAEKTAAMTNLLMQLAIGMMMVWFYETPMPGIGVSFSNLITDSMSYLAQILESRVMIASFQHIDDLWSRFVLPDWTSLAANLMYWALFMIVCAAKSGMIAVVAWGFIASAVCALVGPLFVAFFIVPSLNWLFWGWLKSFIQYSFLPVTAMAYLYIGQHFIGEIVKGMPQTITEDLFAIYGVQAMAVLIAFLAGIVYIPSLTSSLFSGHSHGDNGGVLNTIIRRFR